MGYCGQFLGIFYLVWFSIFMADGPDAATEIFQQQF